MSDLRQELVDAVSEGVFHGLMKFEAQKGVEEAPAKPKAKRAKKEKPAPEPEPEVEVEEEDELAAPEPEAEAEEEAIDYETMMTQIKLLIADYAAGPDDGKILAIETLKSDFNVDKFKALDPKHFAQAVTMMTTALS